MIGRKVPQKEIREQLSRRVKREALTLEIKEELRQLERGECLAYKADNLLITRLALSGVIADLGGRGIYLIIDGDKEVYIYREK